VKVVSDIQTTMRTNSQYLAPSISESWLRRYQVPHAIEYVPLGLTIASIGTSGSHSPLDDNFRRRRVLATCHQSVCFVHSEHYEPNLLTSIHNHHRYDDPSAEPVPVHRRSKTAKQTTESPQEQSEDSTAAAVLIETDVH